MTAAAQQASAGSSAHVAARVAFDRIRYANCWEDGLLLVDALQPAPGKRILSIASAGDNSLLLLSKGAEVVAADLNQTQLACLDLRVVALRHLDDRDALAFLGFCSGSDRQETYRQLRSDLRPFSQTYWDAHPEAIQNGVIHAGKFEAYFRLFRTKALPWVHSRKDVEELLTAKTATERQVFYDRVWNSWRWRTLFRFFFSRFMMGRLGRDPEFFRYVEGSVGDRILARTRTALCDLEPAENPYLHYILKGSFEGAMPEWTHPEALAGIRKYADQLTLFHGGVEEAAAAMPGYDGFNLSDIFEYMDEPTTVALYGQLLRAARPGARLAYWNMLVPRERPDQYQKEVAKLGHDADVLFARDRACFYSAFRLEEVRETSQGGAG